jgi:hypothetical protein
MGRTAMPTGEKEELEHEEHCKAREQDVAVALVGGGPHHVAVTPALERKYLRRTDVLLMPVLFISFGLQYMDKTCLTGAALFGIIQDLDLYQIVPASDGKGETTSLQKYAYVSMIFFWGYLVGGKNFASQLLIDLAHLIVNSFPRCCSISKTPFREICGSLHYAMGRGNNLYNGSEVIRRVFSAKVSNSFSSKWIHLLSPTWSESLGSFLDLPKH